MLLIHSGIDDFPNVTENDLHLAMPILARHKVPLLVHAELDAMALTRKIGAKTHHRTGRF